MMYEAVKALNNLQSNAAYLQNVKTHNSATNTNLKDTRKYLLRSGITMEELDKLSVIHVAGTKGKGSTCAFIEAIIRKHGFITGFYSSPHLINVRERLRINGQPMPEEEFTQSFWKVYESLDKKKEHDTDMPQYFKFLTVLMFHVFLEVKVDVAIIEVGIGGEHDCTNIVRNPVCVGITSLGLDHTMLLGSTLESIAFQKSGIFKENTRAFTVSQPKEAMTILERRAKEKHCDLSIVTNYQSYNWRNGPPTLSIQSKVQWCNASLAIDLSKTWISWKTQNPNFGNDNGNNTTAPSTVTNQLNNNTTSSTEVTRDLLNASDSSTQRKILNISNSKLQTKLNSSNSASESSLEKLQCSSTISFEKVAEALSSCKWPGRTQILCGKSMDFYVDGAHTIESIEFCVSWFKDVTRNSPERRYLIFNSTGARDSLKLLKPFRTLSFEKVFFVPNVAGTISKTDQQNFSVTTQEQIRRCQWHCEIWGDGSTFANSVSEALERIKKDSSENSNLTNKPQVLITGSLHLVGAALALIDPDLTMTTNY
ncbi:folylpolyglutamate synthase, mitochondrial-like isoform X2 [Cephus cinctus]|uniref:Folylpolyglutamate synthase n=1 Tax=Cephus cinctus TaxID=211228 RepID=A0AAJ7FSB0_CEPCN|nr:folylpolyglutamate synthase, mitochondrial-like isoform X2 [Cephus cinctus]XP_024945872.1 folylpolyglutamate synthase, mitochondrial-like isoform X2 [Cephus cinctus]